MDRLLDTSTMSLMKHLNATANWLNGAADRQRRKADADASRAAIRDVPFDLLLEQELLGIVLEHDACDDGRTPPIVLLADTLARHAPPVRGLHPFTREARAA